MIQGLIDIRMSGKVAKIERYMIVRIVENECWYYGSWAEKEKALEVLKELGKDALLMESVEE